MIRGFDVYDGQGDIDFAAARAAGYTLGIFKATQGTGNVQSTFATNRAAARAAGFGPIGAYHFAQNGDPVAQADHFCDVVGTLGPDEFPILDIEGNATYFTLPLSQWPAFILAWCGRVEARLGRTPTVYMSESPASQMPASVAVDFPLWVAGYPGGAAPTEWVDWQVGPWKTPAIWQYSSTGRVPGIGNGAVNVDVNIAPDDLRARLGLTQPAPPTQQEALSMQRQLVTLDPNGVPVADYLWLGPERIFTRITTGGVFDVLKAGNDVPRVVVDAPTLDAFRSWAANANFTG